MTFRIFSSSRCKVVKLSLSQHFEIRLSTAIFSVDGTVLQPESNGFRLEAVVRKDYEVLCDTDTVLRMNSLSLCLPKKFLIFFYRRSADRTMIVVT